MVTISRREKYSGQGYKVIKKDVEAVNFNFTLDVFKAMCLYVIQESRQIRTAHLINLRNLMLVMNVEPYQNDPERMKRIAFINKALDLRINKKINNKYTIISGIYGGMESNDIVDVDKDILPEAEIKWINDTISSCLKYAFIENDVDRMLNILTRFKAADYNSRDEIVAEVEDMLDSMKTKFRRVKVESVNNSMFSLADGHFNEMITDVHAQVCSPSSRILTGMHSLNELTYGGFESGRVYMIFGLPGVGKSVTLLNIAYQIKKNNKGYVCKDPTKRPAVVLLTMENTVRETVERIYSLSSNNNQEMKNVTVEECINTMQTEGELYLNDQSPIDIIVKYVPNGSVDTGYLYSLVEELEDEGIETIALVQDYIKCIHSAYKVSDIRLELGEVVKEMKVFGHLKDIPVITASQLNRDAAKEIDSAKMTGKADMTRMLGRANVGESMLMIENIDWGAIINIEYDSKGHKYLIFNRCKIRGKSTPRYYMCHPFVQNNDMKLIEDIYGVPVFKESLKEQIADMSLFNNGSVPMQNIPKQQLMPNKKPIAPQNGTFLLSKIREQKIVQSIDHSTLAHVAEPITQTPAVTFFKQNINSMVR